MINTAIVGFGRSAKTYHLPFIKLIKEFNVNTFVSSKKDLVLKDYPEATVYDSVEELALDSSIELVIVATPVFKHYNDVKILLNSGKNIVIEKPFTATSLEAEELIDLARDKNLNIFVFQNRRWDSGFIKLKDLISEGTLGDIYHYELHFDRWRPDVLNRWREREFVGSGLLYELGAHFIDQALILFGKPDSIHVDLAKQKNGSKVIDYYHLIFKYSKSRVILHASSLARGQSTHLVVHGSKASFIQGDLDKQELLLLEGVIPYSKEWQEKNINEASFILTKEGSLEQDFKKLSYCGNYGDFYRAVLDTMINNEVFPVNLQDIIEVTKIIEEISSS